ncbi:MAG: methylmalonyl-CoA mutase family protein [Elusimicrobiota bacterium]
MEKKLIHTERKAEFDASSCKIERVYSPASGDIAGFDYSKDIGEPGNYPFTRGIQSTMYRGRLWTMRQYAGFGSAQETNKRYKYLLQQGQTGLSVAFDLPTQLGYDSDDKISLGEVGKVGVVIDTLADMEKLFEDIPLDKITVSMTINSSAIVLLAMYVAYARKRSIDAAQLGGTVQNDILKEYIARGTYIFPPEQSMRLTTDIIEYCTQKMPKWNPISVSGYHIREAGATAVQELAFTLSNGIAYIEAALKRGFKVDDIAPRFSFFFGSHNNLLEEVAKFRSARFLWSKIMKERFAAQSPRSMMLRFHTQTDGCTLTAQQPQNNIVRVTLQALAAVLGGTQSLHTNSYDEALGLPSEQSVKIALRTQQIIAEESGAADTVDPLAGSYAVESLTNCIKKQAQSYIDKIDSLGGAVKAIDFVKKEIDDSSYQYQKKIENGEINIVGLNKYADKEKYKTGKILKVSARTGKKQSAFLHSVKKKRNSNKVANALQSLKNAARGNDNLVEPVIDCVNEYATIGEICAVLREVFGEYR